MTTEQNNFITIKVRKSLLIIISIVMFLNFIDGIVYLKRGLTFLYYCSTSKSCIQKIHKYMYMKDN